MTEPTAPATPSAIPSAAAPTLPRAALGEVEVARIGYGAMQLAGPGVMGPPPDRAAAVAVLRRAVELGVDHVDTAEFYGPTVVNEIIREALHPYPEQLQLVTKVGARRDAAGAWIPAATPQELVEQVHQNLRTLGTDRLALVNLRRFEDPDHYPDEPALADQLAALAGLREAGDVAMIGVSTVGADTVRQAHELVGLGEVQNAYSILDRSDEPVLQLCRELGISYVPYFPLGSAFTGGPAALAADPQIAAVAERTGATPSQVALAWLLTRSEQLLLIPGTRSVAHLEENLGAAQLRLQADDLAALEQVQPVRAGH